MCRFCLLRVIILSLKVVKNNVYIACAEDMSIRENALFALDVKEI